MLDWLRSTVTGDLEAARAAGGHEWALGKDGQELFLAPAGVEPQEWHAERITQWTYPVDHCCRPEEWGECNVTTPTHIAIHDPRDTIARCEAELALLDDFIPVVEELDHIAYSEGLGSLAYGEPRELLIKTLALGYRHREGFNPDWVSG